MAVLIPVAAAVFTGVAGASMVAGAVAGSLAAISGYAMIGGAVLTAAGALSGKKSLMKIGAVLSLGGAVGGLAAAAGVGAAAAGEAGAAAATGAGSASEATAANLFSGAGTAGEAGISSAGSLFDSAASQALNSAAEGTSAFTGGGLFGAEAAATPIQQAASGLTGSDVTGFMTKASKQAGDAAKGIGGWIKENKELVDIGGKALAASAGGGGGADGDLADLAREKWEYQRSLMDRARANLNNPVKLYQYKGA